MTAPLSLFIDSAAPSVVAAFAASLPASVRVSTTLGDSVVVHGGSDWPERVADAIGKGARRILILDPCANGAVLFGPVVALAEKRGVRITLSETHADNPATVQVGEWLGETFGVHTITGQGEDSLADLVLQQLRIVRATGLHGLELDNAVTSPDAVVATLSATLADTPVMLRLTAARTVAGPAHHALMAHAPDASASLVLYSGPAARPAEAMRMTGEGGHCLPTIYEHAHRASLRAMVAGADGTADDIRHWLGDAAMARAIAASG